MQLLKRLKEEHTVTIIAEFRNEDKALTEIAKLSDYISSISENSATILTDLQSHPAGYRITYTIKYFNKNLKIFKLAKLSEWLSKDTNCISRYHYNIV